MHVITLNNMPHFKQPDEFNFTQPAEWPTWSRRFLLFRLAEILHKEDGDIQVSSLLYTMGQESETIMRTFALKEVEQKNFYTVMSKFDFYFRPKVNYIEYRVAFQQRAQKHEESIEQFTRALYETCMKIATMVNRSTLSVTELYGAGTKSCLGPFA